MPNDEIHPTNRSVRRVVSPRAPSALDTGEEVVGGPARYRRVSLGSRRPRLRRGRAVGLRSPQSVGNVVRREMGAVGGRRGVLTELGQAVFMERSESLLLAHWPAALGGDYDASTVCLRVLDEQARFYGPHSPS